MDTQISHTDFTDTLQVLNMWKHDRETHDINTDHSLHHQDDDDESRCQMSPTPAGVRCDSLSGHRTQSGQQTEY